MLIIVEADKSKISGVSEKGENSQNYLLHEMRKLFFHNIMVYNHSVLMHIQKLISATLKVRMKRKLCCYII